MPEDTPNQTPETPASTAKQREPLSPSQTRTQRVLAYCWRRAMGIFEVCALLAAAGTLIGFLGATWWVLDLFANFRVQYAFVLVAGFAAFTLQRKWWRAAIIASLLMVNAVTFAPFYLDKQAPAQPNSPVLKILSFNVQRSNPDRAAVVDYIKHSDADLVLLMETSGGWPRLFDKANIPYRLALEEEDMHNFGMILLTRIPIDDVEITNYRAGGVTAATCVVTLGGKRVKFLGIHPPPPGNDHLAARRSIELAMAGEWLMEHDGPRVLVGDFNATPWSADFRALERATGMRHAMLGNGMAPTWDGHFWPYSIAIDHCMFSKELTCIERRCGPALGSDHRPMHYTLALAAK